MDNTEILHLPVMKDETIKGLSIDPHDIYLDGTIGSGGHAESAIENAGGDITVIALDKDKNALSRSRNRLENFIKEKGYKDTKLFFSNTSFSKINQVLLDLNIEKVDKILFDIGVSSEEIDISGRGFSFMKDEPLLMTLNDSPTNGDTTAYTVLNTWEEKTLADVIYGFGEERYARRIASQIVKERKINPIKTTFDLVRIINNSVPERYKNGKINPATRTFQAIRIAVNDELNELKNGLSLGFDCLKKDGKMAVITFHSLEDRIVKNFFRDKVKANSALLINKKPIVPSNDEIVKNRRSRSAKLRIIQKII